MSRQDAAELVLPISLFQLIEEPRLDNHRISGRGHFQALVSIDGRTTS